MKILAKVDFPEVLQVFRSENKIQESSCLDTNADAEKLLFQTNEQLEIWNKAVLNRQDVLQIMLPWHLGCGGQQELIPKSGLTVKQTIKILQEKSKTYKIQNPICWQKIARHAENVGEEASTLFLSTEPVLTEDHLFTSPSTGLLHLDGLHRTIAWELHNLLGRKFINVNAYIAGEYL